VSGQLHAPGRFTPSERDPGTHWIGGWVGQELVIKMPFKIREGSGEEWYVTSIWGFHDGEDSFRGLRQPLLPEDGGSMVLLNVGILPQNYTHHNPEDLDLDVSSSTSYWTCTFLGQVVLRYSSISTGVSRLGVHFPSPSHWTRDLVLVTCSF